MCKLILILVCASTQTPYFPPDEFGIQCGCTDAELFNLYGEDF